MLKFSNRRGSKRRWWVNCGRYKARMDSLRLSRGKVCAKLQTCHELSYHTCFKMYHITCPNPESRRRWELRNVWDLGRLAVLKQEDQYSTDISILLFSRMEGTRSTCFRGNNTKILPDNYEMSRRMSFPQRLQQEREVLKEYDVVIKYQLSKGMVVIVKQDFKEMDKVRHISHQAVIRRNKRIVCMRALQPARISWKLSFVWGSTESH